MSLDIVQMVLVTVLAAATPLILAAIGELVVERAGVLNLGVEGMMVFGAAAGFAVATETGSTGLGALGGAGAGLLLAALFGVLTVGLAANQVASGLALTILGLGLSGLVGAGYVGMKRDPAPPSPPARLHRPAGDRPAAVRTRRLRLRGPPPRRGGVVVPLAHPRRADAARHR